jgi:hypothetical protein
MVALLRLEVDMQVLPPHLDLHPRTLGKNHWIVHLIWLTNAVLFQVSH